MTLLHAAQSGQHPHAVRGAELYETPACATEALLRVERLDHWVWEPCAGRGAIATVLRDHGYAVVASDLIRYDGFDLHFTADFLAQTKAPTDCMSVVTNPPFRLINEFIAHALGLVSRVIVLARLALLESERRASLFDGGHLTRVHVFRRRLPMLHREGWAGPRATSAICFAWFVFYAQPTVQAPTIGWI
jgi:hypothetical protein